MGVIMSGFGIANANSWDIHWSVELSHCHHEVSWRSLGDILLTNQESKSGRSTSRFPYSIFRNLVELFGFLLLNLLAFRYMYPFLKIEPFALPVPILISLRSTYSFVGGALDFIQVALSKPLLPIISFAVIFIVGAVFGRLLCGWLCPMGFIQDLILKTKGRQTRVSDRKHESLLKLKIILLCAVLFISVSLAISLYRDPETSYKDALGPFAGGLVLPIEPETTLFSYFPRLVQTGTESGLLNFTTPTSPGYMMAFGFTLLAIFLAGAYITPWFWCRYVCPTGALMGLFMKFSFLGLKRDPSKCKKCGECVNACPMQIRILDLPWEKFNDPECTLCLECVGACSSGALTTKFP